MKQTSLKGIICSLAAVALMVGASSCSTQKNIGYFQDAETGQVFEVANSEIIKITPQDKLRIIVTTQDQRLTDLFNLSVPQGMNVSTGSAENSIGYIVDSYGDIDFPVLGTIHVGDLTREQVAEKIKNELKQRDLVKDPVVNVEFANLSVTVLGEVAHPGRVRINKDEFTVLDAIAEAGDLTIYGIRDNVLVIRNVNGEQKAYTVNLTSAKDVYSSPVYYLEQGDMIYVEPNKTKANQSELNANTLRTPTFWMSLASVVASISVIIYQTTK